jgi:hypothetical protein
MGNVQHAQCTRHDPAEYRGGHSAAEILAAGWLVPHREGIGPGRLEFHPGSSKAGDYVDLSFEMDTLVVLSTAPHPLDPSKTYRPGAVNLAAFATPSTVSGDFRWQAKEPARIPENERGLQNTQRLYTCGGVA